MQQQIRIERQTSLKEGNEISERDEASEEDEERWQAEENALAFTPRDWRTDLLQAEIRHVEILVRLAKAAEAKAERTGAERKLEEVRRVLQDPFKDGRDFQHSGERLLIFTENKETHDYLKERFDSWGYRVANIHGGMNERERLIQMKNFENPNGPKVMVATEAAGEGINLQFCRLMVNYDLPWNPNRLEQRMGRIHRYLQEHDVFIYNLASIDTAEGHVLSVLFRKLEVMRRDLGSDLVYDVVGDLIAEAELTELIQQAVRNKQSFEETEAAVEAQLASRVGPFKLRIALQNALATDVMRQERLEEIRGQTESASQRRRLLEDATADFIVSAFRVLCVDEEEQANIRQDSESGAWAIDRIPPFLRQVAPTRTFPARYNRIVFHSEMYKRDPSYEFVTFGHPLFTALQLLVRERYEGILQRGARFTIPQNGMGMFWLLQNIVTDRTGNEIDRWLFGVEQQMDGTLRAVDPLQLLTMQPLSAPEGRLPPVTYDSLRKLTSMSQTIEEWTRTNEQQPRLHALRAVRAARADIRDEYLARALASAIRRAHGIIEDLDELYDPKDPHADEKRRREARGDLQRCEERLRRGGEESQTLRSVGANPPRVIGLCGLIPPPPGMTGNIVPVEIAHDLKGANRPPPPGIPVCEPASVSRAGDI